jgi:phage baseplate assembly protein W
VPLTSISRGFKDISLSFKRHPITNDILLGTRITGSLFELASKDFTDPIQTEIETVITNFEPRVNLKNVKVQPTPDENSLEVEISYDIIGLSGLPQIVNFILETTRL